MIGKPARRRTARTTHHFDSQLSRQRERTR
nr:MAG TPA: hypothetical protein [Caudoviricetes sp.]